MSKQSTAHVRIIKVMNKRRHLNNKNIIAKIMLERKKEIRLRICYGVLIRSLLLFTYHLNWPPSSIRQAVVSSWVWSGGRMTLQRMVGNMFPFPISHHVWVMSPGPVYFLLEPHPQAGVDAGGDGLSLL